MVWVRPTRGKTRSTIEVLIAHFRSNFLLNDTGLFNPKSSECVSCFEKWHLCIVGPWNYPSGMQLDFLADVSFRLRDGAPKVGEPQKIQGEPLPIVERLETCRVASRTAVTVKGATHKESHPPFIFFFFKREIPSHENKCVFYFLFS